MLSNGNKVLRDQINAIGVYRKSTARVNVTANIPSAFITLYFIISAYKIKACKTIKQLSL